MTLDPKWMEILKANGWQTAFLAIGFAVFLLLVGRGVLSAEASLLNVVVLMLTVCAALALASIAQAVARPAHHWVQRRLVKRRLQREIAEYIPFMTAKERQIIGHLLEHKLKSFTCALDGGQAATLLSRGIIVVGARRGQLIEPDDVPMVVPDYVWEVLERHRDEFPHRPDLSSRGEELEPWRVERIERDLARLGAQCAPVVEPGVLSEHQAEKIRGRS